MNKSMKIIKPIFLSIFFMLFLTSCSVLNKNLIDISTDFETLVDDMVEESYPKLKKNIAIDDIILVSDFVNLDNLQNHSKLGFLLADNLKNSLSKRDIIIRQVELGTQFTLGKHGFNVLTRDQSKIDPNVKDAFYAAVGTYSITKKRLIVFMKLIDIRTGHILTSSSNSVILDGEIRDLESTRKLKHSSTTYAPLVL